jgi:hypothetical protein
MAEHDDRIGRIGRRSSVDRLALLEGATAADRGENLVVGRIIDHADLHLATNDEGDGDAPVTKASDIICRAVDRIDDPGAGRAGLAAGFLAHECVVWKAH